MSGQDDPFSSSPHGGGWGQDEKSQPMIVMQSPQGGDIGSVVVSRRSQALLWMGGFLGAFAIATLVLLVAWLNTRAQRDANARELSRSVAELAKKEKDLGVIEERADNLNEAAGFWKTEFDKLEAEHNELRAKRGLKPRERPDPAPTKTTWLKNQK